MKHKLVKKVWDFIGIPFRFVLFDQKWLPIFGWTTLEEERLQAVLPYLKGRLLDIGAGSNNLVKKYGSGIGVDVFDWGGGAIVVKDTSNLPFKDESFDTITFIACLNHIPNRREVIGEASRLLAQNGRIIVTMIDPLLGGIGHAIWWYSEDKQRGGMKKGEVGGMWTGNLVDLFEKEKLRLKEHHRFEFGLNHLYLFEKRN